MCRFIVSVSYPLYRLTGEGKGMVSERPPVDVIVLGWIMDQVFSAWVFDQLVLSSTHSCPRDRVGLELGLDHLYSAHSNSSSQHISFVSGIGRPFVCRGVRGAGAQGVSGLLTAILQRRVHSF
jgi:hypothetical protein